MVLGLTYAEVLVILAAAAAAFGPKEIPLIARAAGRIAGRTAGYLQYARTKFDTFAERTQINELHNELQETLSQVEAIRQELKTGVSLTNSGPLTRRIMKLAGATSPTPSSQVDKQETLQERLKTEGLSPAASAALVDGTGPYSEDSLNSASIWVEDQTTFPSNLRGESAEANPARATVKPFVSVNSARTDALQRSENIEVLPVSAVSAGLIPASRDSWGGGADILSDAIIEQKVALDSMRFMKLHKNAKV